MNDDRQWVVACYLEDGSHHGWHTLRSTLSFLSSSALRFSSKQAADNRIVRLEATWPTSYLWCAEREPKYDIDVRTGARLDTINRQPLESSLPQTDGLSVQQGESMPVKKKIVKPATKAVTPVPKMKLRTTSAKAKKAASKAASAAASNGASRTSRLPCLCGCGESSTSFLKRGHFKRILGYIRDIKAGELKPEKAFGSKQLAAAWGPWTPTRGGGLVTKTKDYAKVRANLSA